MEIKIFVFSDNNNINNTHQYKIHEYNNIIMYIQSYIKKTRFVPILHDFGSRILLLFSERC